jgi:phosphoglycolate phosphatase-like HAD superfamily hydrolase
MFEQSKPYPEMIELIKSLKKRYGLKIIAVSNEARELNTYRIEEFGLAGFIDFLFPQHIYTYVNLTQTFISWRPTWPRCRQVKLST